MYGPEEMGHWSSIEAFNFSDSYKFLQAGKRYSVIRPFTDFDGDLHDIGEKWTFLGCSFLPYEDGLSWFVTLDGLKEWHIRLKLIPEEQSGIAYDLIAHIRPDK
jgi:hypothetical protein